MPLATPTKTSVKYSQQGGSNKTTLKIGGEVVETYDGTVEVATPEQWSMEDWIGVTTKGNETVFMAGTMMCWNCRGNHCLSACSKPCDQECVKCNRKVWQKQHKKKKQNGGGNGGRNRGGKSRGSEKTFKWRKPELHEHNHCIIDEKTHVYDPDTKRWELQSPTETDHSSGVHIVVDMMNENAELSTSKVLAFANASSHPAGGHVRGNDFWR
jgi:hypothetical protein